MRVLVLFCEEGEGHASAARSLAADLHSELAGVEVVVADALAGGLGRLIPFFSRDLYRVQVRWLRWTYGLEYWFFARFPPGRALARWGLGVFGSRPLLRLLAGVEPELIVSTHPSVTNVLGRLRQRGRVSVPVVATITDFGVHPLWVHRGVDLHLVMHEGCVPLVEGVAGRGAARVSRAVVAPAFRERRERSAARRGLGLPLEGAVAVVSGGGWGVGDLCAAVEAAVSVPSLTVVCLAGRNEQMARRLRDRFVDETRVRIVSFTQLVDEYLAAADILIDASVGVTCLEALSRGCRIVVYGAPPGHSRYNARVLAALGLAERARSRRALVRLLGEPLSGLRLRLAEAPSAPSLIAAVQIREPVRSSIRARRLATVGAVTTASLVLAGWTFASPSPYPLVARTLDLNPTTNVSTRRSDVALVVSGADTRQLGRLAGELSRLGLHASFAVSVRPALDVRGVVVRNRDELLPELHDRGPAGLISERRRVRALARALGHRGRFPYLVPRRGFTLADYLIARAAGGRPVGAAVRVGGQGVEGLDSLRRGAVVVVDANSAGDSAPVAVRLAGLLRARGLVAAPLSSLLDWGASTAATGTEPARSSAPTAIMASASSSPTSRGAEDGHSSPTTSGARATGTNAVNPNTSGATCVTGRRCSADISLNVPTPDATFIATTQTSSPTQRWAA